jgi:putative methanogenesis marker protein 17
MIIESNDHEGAKVYEMITKQILQDLLLAPALSDLKAYVNPNEVVFIMAMKMKKTSKAKHLNEVSSSVYDPEKDLTTITINDENFLPNILKKLWKELGRENVHQPSRYIIELSGKKEVDNWVIDNPYENLKRRCYDAMFRIVPEGFKIIKDMSKNDIVAVVATDELIKDKWIEHCQKFIEELENTEYLY